jgi:flagellar hook assembly protein FlgD
VWAATSSGLKKSTDLGVSWSTYDFIQDSFDSLGNQITSAEYFAVRVIGDTVWAGGADGLVKTTDGGTTWKVFRTYVPIGTAGSKTAYAYPSPFSPQLSSGVTRIHYAPKQSGKVTVKIYDFALNLVATLLNNQMRQAGVEYDELWDGKNQDGKIVANGIYFFKVEAEGGQREWGKVAVIR